MWGSTQTLALTAAAGGGAGSSGQLARVNYRRPDHWSFFFSAQVLQAALVGATATLDVFFDLLVGVGRSVQSIPGFEHYTLALVNPDPTGANNALIWSATVNGPKRSATDVVGQNQCAQFPAQDIQCNVRTVFTSAAAATAQLQVQSFFAPTTHVRPEWYSPDRGEQTRFRGDEDGGT